MGNFGQELRRERESRGIAIETISGDTKISGRHLLSLEEGQFDALPGGVLSKGIVRGYARVVGLDEEDCVRRYLAECQQSGLEKQEDAGWAEFATNVGRNRKGAFEGRTGLQWAGVALLLTLLAVFGWYVAHFVRGRVSQAVFSPASVAAMAAPRPTSRSAPAASAPAGTVHAGQAPAPVRAAPEQAGPIESTLDKSTPDRDALVAPGTSGHDPLLSASAQPGSTAANSVESHPAESTPAQSTPTQSTPNQSTPNQSTPNRSTPNQSLPAGPVPTGGNAAQPNL